MSKILIIGASRGIGLETVKAAIEAGHDVRAFARTASKIPLENALLEKFDGDALSETDVARALEGISTVVLVLGMKPGPAYFSKTDLFSEATKAVTRAMAERQINRLIVVTGIGAGDSRGHGGLLYDALIFPILLKRIYDDKDIQEDIVKATSLSWTIVRPGLLKDGPATRLYQALTNPQDWYAASITRADVAQFIVDEIDHPDFVHQTPLLIS